MLRSDLVMILLPLMLGGCASRNPVLSGATSTTLPQPDIYTRTPTAVASPPPAPSSTPHLNTPAGPTPSLPGSSEDGFDFGDFFFDTSTTPDCMLPCWRGLIVGESGQSEVQAVIDATFAFNHRVDFFTNTPPHAGLLAFGVETGLPDLYTVGYDWFVDDDKTASFYLVAGLDEDDSILRVLAFTWGTRGNPAFRFRMSPQLVLREMGTPSFMLASVETFGTTDFAGAHLMLIYDEGIGFDFHGDIPAQVAPNATQTDLEMTIEYCLAIDQSPVENGPMGGAIFILSPFESGLNGLDSVQDAIAGRNIRFHQYVPVQEVFGVTAEQITQLVLQEDNACLRSHNLLDD